MLYIDIPYVYIYIYTHTHTSCIYIYICMLGMASSAWCAAHPNIQLYFTNISIPKVNLLVSFIHLLPPLACTAGILRFITQCHSIRRFLYWCQFLVGIYKDLTAGDNTIDSTSFWWVYIRTSQQGIIR